ncbi:MAG TPA: hypothetical protein H9937_02670 [Candidatus Alistipes stercorigallinarum]|nr:hypothetical protein [Candidatus Alistipes stercorigallinarum]
MPNWCSTSYVVTGDKNEVRDLYEKMRSLEEREKPLVKNGFGVTWLGNLVTLLGRSWEEVSCRGEWSGLTVDIDNNELRFHTMTAWAELWQLRHFLQEKYPSLTFYFRTEEPGMCIFQTNDKEGTYFPERYKVEHWDEEGEYCMDVEAVFDTVSDITGTTVQNLEEMNKAIDTYNEVHEYELIYIYVFETVED